MSETKWTPGPWKHEGREIFHEGEGAAVIAILADHGHMSPAKPIEIDSPHWETAMTNAHLIAAAPALYAACQGLLAMLEEWDAGSLQPWIAFLPITQAHAALKSATGKK